MHSRVGPLPRAAHTARTPWSVPELEERSRARSLGQLGTPRAMACKPASRIWLVLRTKTSSAEQGAMASATTWAPSARSEQFSRRSARRCVSLRRPGTSARTPASAMAGLSDRSRSVKREDAASRPSASVPMSPALRREEESMREVRAPARRAWRMPGSTALRTLARWRDSSEAGSASAKRSQQGTEGTCQLATRATSCFCLDSRSCARKRWKSALSGSPARRAPRRAEP
mmetsp:Transcript_5794/g.16893  ORF Transcript_5794/g.16893 Transcript_5794/m.16893 type:complete len:230 (-) Transcript_5794:968-1657(-)